MNKILTAALVTFLLPGCSSLSFHSSDSSEDNFSVSIFEDAPICSFKMVGRQTYWSSFEDGKIYLFVGKNRMKCLLK